MIELKYKYLIESNKPNSKTTSAIQVCINNQEPLSTLGDCIQYPPGTITGSTVIERLDEEFYIISNNITPLKKIKLIREAGKEDNFLVVFINLSENSIKVSENNSDKFISVGINEENSIVLSNSLATISTTLEEGKTLRSLTIIISKTWLQKRIYEMDISLENVIEEDFFNDLCYCVFTNIDTVIMSLANNILNECQNVPHFLRKTYSFGNVLKLLVRMYTNILERKLANPAESFTMADVSRLLQLNDDIKKDILNIPTINVAANNLCMSITKFKYLFKKVFGESYGKYWQKYRMELAYNMLKNGHRKVSDVAYEIGFSNLGYFSGLYKKTYGVLPKSEVKGKINAYAAKHFAV